MGVLKKKPKKTEELLPPAPVMDFELAMQNTTTLSADENGEFCYGIFQTDKALSPAEWQMLATKAREGAKLVLYVIENESKDDD